MTTENCLHGPGITCGLCETKATDAKATLSPERTRCEMASALLDVAARIGVAANPGWVKGELERLANHFKQCECKVELATLRNQLAGAERVVAWLKIDRKGHTLPVYEKTTVEEARGVYKVWGDSIGMQVGLVAMASAIDKLIEKRLPRLAGGGMTIEERISKAFDTAKLGRLSLREMMTTEMQQAVAEAVATPIRTIQDERVAHAKELQEEKQKRYDEFCDQKAKHNSELAQQRSTFELTLAQARDDAKREALGLCHEWISKQEYDRKLSEERANWQARMTEATVEAITEQKNCEEERVRQAVAAAYEEAAQIAEVEANLDERGWDTLRAKAIRIRDLIRDRAAKPQEEAEEACQHCGIGKGRHTLLCITVPIVANHPQIWIVSQVEALSVEREKV